MFVVVVGVFKVGTGDHPPLPLPLRFMSGPKRADGELDRISKTIEMKMQRGTKNMYSFGESVCHSQIIVGGFAISWRA